MTATTWTINDIKAAVRATGSHWFDPDTMRCFGTRVSETVYQGSGGVYFVTSEQPPHGPRRFSVRSFNPETADIGTVGEHCSMSRGVAHRTARDLAGPDVETVAETFNPVTVQDQFLHDCRLHGRPDTDVQFVRILIHDARWHHRLMEAACNGLDIYDADGEPLRDLARCRRSIERNAEHVGATGVIFSGDPRGCTVKLTWKDGETDDFGREGWCIPTE